MQRRAVHVLLSAVVGLSLAQPALAQPLIEHRDVRCVSSEQFTQFLARIRPPEGVRTAKLYFRSYLYPDFYYVELAVENDVHHGVLPIPTEETTRIVYYIEAVDDGFNTSRSEEFVIDVDDRCRPGPDAALFTGQEPGIIVGSTKTGLSAIPPGFRAAGIGGFITAAGTLAGASGGGIGAGVAIGAAVGAAAGVGVVVTQSGEEGGTTTTALTTTTTTATASGGGSTTTAPVTTTTGSGPSTSTTSSSTSTSSIASTTTTSTPLVACFTWNALGNCRMRFDSCSTPVSAIDSYAWRMLGPPPNLDIGSTAGFTFDFSPYDPRCTGAMNFNRPIRLTVTDASGNFAETQENVSVIPSGPLRVAPTGASVRVQLHGPAGASIVLRSGSRTDRVTATTGRLELRLPLDDNGSAELEAQVIETAGESLLLVIELDEPATLAGISQGNVETRSPNRVAFHLSSNGETVRLRAGEPRR